MRSDRQPRDPSGAGAEPGAGVGRSRIRLEIPPQRTAQDGAVALTRRGAKQWVDQLPLANVGETAKRTYRALYEFNRTSYPILERAEIIEIFREPVRYINSNLATHYVEVGFPLAAKGRKAADLAVELVRELATGYKIIISEMLAGSDSDFNRDLLILCLHRALQYLGQALFHSYLAYLDPPKGVWGELHGIYAFASQNFVHRTPVKDSARFRWRQDARSIEDLYQGFVLLASISPYRLRQSQLRRLHEVIPQWTRLTQILELDDVTHDAGVFYINLWSDSPPDRFLSPDAKDDKRFIAFDLNALLAKVRTDFESAPWDSPTKVALEDQQLSRSLLRLLIKGWNKSLDRKFARTQLHIELNVIPGLTNIYWILQSGREQLQSAQGPGQQPAKDKSRTSRLTWNDSVFSTLAMSRPVASSASDSIFADSLAAASTILDDGGQDTSWRAGQNKTEDLFSVLTYNENLEGYCLRWHGKRPPKIKVGEVMAIQSEQNPREFSLSVVRWLKHRGDEDLFLGIQIISSKCDSVVIVPSGLSPRNPKHHHRALLLTGDGLDPKQLGLIVNSRDFEPGDELTLITEFGQHRIRLSQWVESSASFIHYQFGYVERERQQPGPDVRQESEDRFGDLWQDL